MKKFLVYSWILGLLSIDFLLSSQKLTEEFLLLKGKWKKFDYKISGEWKIVQRGKGESKRIFFVLDDEFETVNGPDLHIVFSTNRLKDIDHDHAVQGALIVGELKTQDTGFFKRMKGAQEWKIKSSWEELKKYQSVLIYCIKFSHLWGGATVNFRIVDEVDGSKLTQNSRIF